jgi:hypothetical protein
MYFITIGEQQLGQVRAVLAGDASNKRFFQITSWK